MACSGSSNTTTLGQDVSSVTAAAPGHRSIEIDINSKKIEADVDHGVKVGSEKLHNLLDGDKEPAAPTTPPPGRPR